MQILFFYQNLKDSSPKVNLVLSRLFCKQKTLEKELNQSIHQTAERLVETSNIATPNLKIFSVDNKTDLCCQLADYFSWSYQRMILKNQDIGFSYLRSSQRLYRLNVTAKYCEYLVQFFERMEQKNS
jgi:hypothetical protein